MVGPKLNDGALLVADGRPTTKATAKYVRGSATKVRAVLDLIRGLDVARADEVLRFTTRDAAVDARKVLASAVANAVHNDEQDVEELFVLACYADEGPTLRRFRPRARGRATRIRKRTCHITIVVARMSDERLEVLQNRQQLQQAATRRRRGGTAQSRRERVERSRTRAQALRTGATPEPEEADAELPEDTPAADEDAVDATEVVADEAEEEVDTTDLDRGTDGSAQDAASAGTGTAEGSASDEAEASEPEASETIDTALPDGAVLAPEDGSIPEGYPIKGNANSMLYHQPGGRYYDVTIAEVFFDTPEHAEAAGYSAPASEEGQ
jgi:large subunit ribosomal protein L22